MDLIKMKSPFMVVLVLNIVGQFLAFRGLAKFLLLYMVKAGEEPPLVWLLGYPYHPSYIELGLSVLFLVSGFAFATKVIHFDKPGLRLYLAWSMFFGIVFQYAWLVSSKMVTEVFPFFEESAAKVNIGSEVARDIIVGNMSGIRTLLLLIPTIIVLLIVIWLGKQYIPYHVDTTDFLIGWEYRTPLLNRFFDAQEETVLPDVNLGINIKTKEMVKQYGKDRPLNNAVIGSIGSGKTACEVEPMVNQDLHHMTKFINEYPSLKDRDDYDTEEVKGQYLNGISVIEPSNDLCKNVYKFVQAHGIPEKAVYYIDPTNPNTKGINPLRGPVDKVAESFIMVIEGLAEKQEFFFQQSQRTHLKSYIYLLKLHNANGEPTFDDLIDMYGDPQLVHNMHKALKAQIPKDIESIEDRDEQNHWKIVKNIDKWFDNSLGIVEERSRNATYKVKVESGPFKGQNKYYDKKEEHVVGLRNILDDISANKLIRRVLFGKSDFDMDAHLEIGGVLLVNTAKGELSDLHSVLGKFILLSLQNAVFRREPKVSSYHHIVVDEFPDYIYEPFKDFPSQSRKYKTIITVVAQTVAQLSYKYGDDYLQTLLATFRHKFVFQDIPEKDAELFSKIFGEKEKFEESESDQEVSSMYSGATRRSGYSYKKIKEVIMSPADLIFQPKFVCACKIVVDNNAIPVQQVKANFVPKKEYKKATVQVEESNGNVWLEGRSRFINSFLPEQNKDIQLQANDSISKEIQEDMILDQSTLGRPAYEDNYIEESIDGMPRGIIREPVVVVESDESSIPSNVVAFPVATGKAGQGEADHNDTKHEQNNLPNQEPALPTDVVNSTPKPVSHPKSLLTELAEQAAVAKEQEKRNEMDDIFGEEVDVSSEMILIFGEEVDPSEKSHSAEGRSNRVYSEGNVDFLKEIQDTVTKGK